MTSQKTTQQLLLILTILAFAIVFIFIKPIAQPESYHNFANENMFFEIPNFLNVLSNIGFVFMGFYGFYCVSKYKILSKFAIVLFAAIVFTGFGSAYYHFNPNNSTLVWDRLPMTIVFTTFFAQIYSLYLSKKVGGIIWIFAVFTGIFSVFYWQYSESIGKGDLRLYAIIQFLPMLLLTIIISLHYKKHKPVLKPILLIAFYYFVAKILENFDAQIYETTRFFSGHPLKHIAASIASYYIVVLNVKLKVDKD
jgi:Ceramidase